MQENDVGAVGGAPRALQRGWPQGHGGRPAAALKIIMFSYHTS